MQGWHEKILQTCDVVAENTTTMSQEKFAMLRRNGFGASDMSVILGLQSKWTSREDCIQLKLEKEYTEQEREVADKPVVRMGKDLEPMILEKFMERMNILPGHLVKPTQMYRIRKFPYLTINYDGVWAPNPALLEAELVPVEAKFVSFWGDKYWNFEISSSIFPDGFMPIATEKDVALHCQQMANIYGIPDYYYAQIQQQMMGMDAPYGYFAAMREKDWTLYPFIIKADEWLQRKIIIEGHKAWTEVERRKNGR